MGSTPLERGTRRGPAVCVLRPVTFKSLLLTRQVHHNNTHKPCCGDAFLADASIIKVLTVPMFKVFCCWVRWRPNGLPEVKTSQVHERVVRTTCRAPSRITCLRMMNSAEGRSYTPPCPGAVQACT